MFEEYLIELNPEVDQYSLSQPWREAPAHQTETIANPAAYSDLPVSAFAI